MKKQDYFTPRKNHLSNQKDFLFPQREKEKH
jgi:hypothetical protein